MLTPLRDWVERGQAPDAIQASKIDSAAGATLRTSLLCPHPQVAKYDGAGDAKDAKSYQCALPK